MTDKERRRRENDLRRLRAISMSVSLGRHRSNVVVIPPPPAISAADWRIRSDYTYAGSSQGATNNYFSVAEWELRATVGGADLATGRTSTANAVYSGDTTNYGPQLAFDGNQSTFWGGVILNGMPAAGGFLVANYPSPVAVQQIAIRGRADSNTENPRYLYAEYSLDGRATWTTLYTNLAVPTWTNGEQKLFTIQ